MAYKLRRPEDDDEEEGGEYIPSNDIYLILRVYRIDTQDPQIGLMFDPWTDVRNRAVDWQIDTIAITPKTKQRYRDAMEEA